MFIGKGYQSCHKKSVSITVIITPELPFFMYFSSPVAKAQCARVPYTSSLPLRVLLVTSSPRILSASWYALLNQHFRLWMSLFFQSSIELCPKPKLSVLAFIFSIRERGIDSDRKSIGDSLKPLKSSHVG